MKPVLRDFELAEVLGIARSTFYVRKAAGDYRAFELEQHSTRTATRYSGPKVEEWLRTGVLPTRQLRAARLAAVIRTGKPGRPRTVPLTGGRRAAS